MFGKPEWFRDKKTGCRLAPVCWQGWVYAVVWAAVVLLPFVALLANGRVPEAFIWLAVSSGMVVWDVRQILCQMRTAVAKDDVLYIGEDGADDARLETRKYDLHLRA